MNSIDNKYIVDGITINKSKDGHYRVFTIPTQHFNVKSLDEITNERFEQEIKRQKEYEKDSDELFGLFYGDLYNTQQALDFDFNKFISGNFDDLI